MMKIQDIQENIWVNNEGKVCSDSHFLLKIIPNELLSIIENNIFCENIYKIKWEEVEKQWQAIQNHEIKKR